MANVAWRLVILAALLSAAFVVWSDYQSLTEACQQGPRRPTAWGVPQAATCDLGWYINVLPLRLPQELLKAIVAFVLGTGLLYLLLLAIAFLQLRLSESRSSEVKRGE